MGEIREFRVGDIDSARSMIRALSPRMIRIKTLAADWRRLDERVDEVSTGIAGAEGGSLPEAAGHGAHHASDVFQGAACVALRSLGWPGLTGRPMSAFSAFRG